LAADATRLCVEQVETLATQTEEKILGLTQALETKANNERLTQLTSQMADLEQREADARESAATATSLREALAQKAGVAQMEALTTQTSEKILGLTQALAQKAGVAQVEALAAQSGEKIVNLTNVLETKADNEHITQLTSQLVDLAQRKADAGELAATATRLGEELAQKADAATIQQETLEIQRQILDHKRNILDQQRRLALLLEEARKRLPEPISIGQIENMVAEEDHLLDAFYVSFEDRFRGTREDIKQRVAVYLPIVKEAKAGTKRAPILDIGCGRGEWLQLLQENKFVAGGVDLNRVMVSQCQELGLDVAEADGIAYLRRLKANSLGAVTGIHIIEHIPFKRLIALFDEALRVLKPGGVAIFETPNPENLIVGACNFYYDPTHLNPLPPEPMRFVMEARGFGRIEVVRLHPQPESAMLTEGTAQVQQVVNELMFGPQDYAVVAYKV
ncbi:MAG: methyltransferase domain-containing protein, partial [Acidobacteriota bacterium]